jgi:hypothetical protein
LISYGRSESIDQTDVESAAKGRGASDGQLIKLGAGRLPSNFDIQNAVVILSVITRNRDLPGGMAGGDCAARVAERPVNRAGANESAARDDRHAVGGVHSAGRLKVQLIDVAIRGAANRQASHRYGREWNHQGQPGRSVQKHAMNHGGLNP